MEEVNIRSVCFMRRQDAVDLYRCQDEGKHNRVYARMSCGDGTVKWLTTSRWSGGYEPDCPMKAGLELRIVDGDGSLLFTEVIEHGDESRDNYAVSKAPMSRDEEKRIAHTWAEKHSLLPYEEWRKNLLQARNLYAPSEIADHWLYCYANTISTAKESIVDALGRRLYVECCEMEHTTSHQRWKVYMLKQDNYTNLEICGYEWISD